MVGKPKRLLGQGPMACFAILHRWNWGLFSFLTAVINDAEKLICMVYHHSRLKSERTEELKNGWKTLDFDRSSYTEWKHTQYHWMQSNSLVQLFSTIWARQMFTYSSHSPTSLHTHCLLRNLLGFIKLQFTVTFELTIMVCKSCATPVSYHGLKRLKNHSWSVFRD